MGKIPFRDYLKSRLDIRQFHEKIILLTGEELSLLHCGYF